MPAQPFNLIEDPSHVILAKRTLSGYVNLPAAGGYTLMQSLKRNHPWVADFALNSNQDEESSFACDLFASHSSYSIEYPFEQKRMNTDLVKSTVNHFQTHRVDAFVEKEWGHEVTHSINAPGVLRATLFKAKDEEEMRQIISLITELDVAESLRQYRTASTRNPQQAVESIAKFFTSIVHFYKAMHSDFGRSTGVGQWSREWFNRAFAAHKNNEPLKALRETAIRHVKMCDATLEMRTALIPRYEKLVLELRSMVLRAAHPRELPLIKHMINEVKTCHGMQALVKGVPMPVFNPEMLFSMIKKVENDRCIMSYLAVDGFEESVEPQEEEEPPRNTVQPRTAQHEERDIDAIMQSITSSLPIRSDVVFGNAVSNVLDQLECDLGSYKPPSPAEVLEQSLGVKREVEDIRLRLAESSAELENLKVAAASNAHKEIQLIQAEAARAALELQTIQHDQQRRAVRREVKRIRELQETIFRQMLPFSVDLLQQLAVHEQRQRARAAEKKTLAVIREADRLQELIHILKEETAALLEQHASRERRRMFHAVAPVFLPTAMFEADIDCGLCLQTLDWKQDIGYVACCPEYGYVCAGCLSKPHAGHSIVIEREIVRIVRGVRRAAGV